jgi:hypothetical protein
MKQSKLQQWKTLVVRLSILAGILVAGVFVWNLITNGSEEDEYAIDETPLRIEQIRSILELNTMKFQDEVVVDSLELYESVTDQATGSLEKLFSFNDLENAFSAGLVKRRLTLIVKGELLYGVNLKTSDFQVVPKNDTLYIQLPQPELLSVSINPKSTEVFIENGDWKDFERRALMNKARKRMIATGSQLHLVRKSKEGLERTIRQLIPTNKPLVIQYEGN